MLNILSRTHIPKNPTNNETSPVLLVREKDKETSMCVVCQFAVRTWRTFRQGRGPEMLGHRWGGRVTPRPRSQVRTWGGRKGSKLSPACDPPGSASCSQGRWLPGCEQGASAKQRTGRHGGNVEPVESHCPLPSSRQEEPLQLGQRS